MWIDPIFDRTLADVEYAAANRAGPHVKGAMNYTDWARIAGNIHYLADMLAGYGYAITATCKTSWVRTDRPTNTQVTTMRNDIERIQNGYARIAACPVLSWNTYEKINAIERILYELRDTIERMLAVFPRAGNIPFVYASATIYVQN